MHGINMDHEQERLARCVFVPLCQQEITAFFLWITEHRIGAHRLEALLHPIDKQVDLRLFAREGLPLNHLRQCFQHGFRAICEITEQIRHLFPFNISDTGGQ